MKKYLFLILVLCLKLFSFEDFLFFQNDNINTSENRYVWFIDDNGILKKKSERINGNVLIEDVSNTGYNNLSTIRSDSFTSHYISNLMFQEFYKENLDFLNAWYTQQTNIFLNYLYNDEIFSQYSHINYDNYELLYNSDGLAVESIVNGVWAGLYSDSEKDISGKLYTVDGHLIYRNGDEVNWFDVLFDKLTGGFGASLVGCFYVLGYCVKYVLVVYVVWQVFYLSLRMGKTALNKKDSI